jgi:hypothetical protein
MKRACKGWRLENQAIRCRVNKSALPNGYWVEVIMRNSILVMCCLLLALTAAPASAFQGNVRIAAEIERAAESIFERSDEKEEMQRGFLSLVQALAHLADESPKFPSGFGTKLTAAHSQFHETSIVNPDGIADLHDAYNILTGGKKFVFPEGLAEVSEVVKYGRIKSRKGLDALRGGDPDRAAREILEVILMIVTPRSE